MEYMRAQRFGVGHYREIRLGMTEKEVEAALGCPSGDYRRSGTLPFWNSDRYSAFAIWVLESEGDMQAAGHAESWSGKAGTIEVHYDGQGQVVYKALTKQETSPGPP
jgi:hypothetical protein